MNAEVRRVAVLGGTRIPFARQNGPYARASNQDMLTATLFPTPIYQTYGRAIAEGAAARPRSPIPGKDLGLFRNTAAASASPTRLADLLLEMAKT